MKVMRQSLERVIYRQSNFQFQRQFPLELLRPASLALSTFFFKNRISEAISIHAPVSVHLPAGGDSVGFGLQPGCMWAGFVVDVRLRALQSQWGHAGVVVGGPEGWRADGGAQIRRAVGDGLPGVAQHRLAVKVQGSVAVVVLVAAVRVRRRDADGVAVHAQRRAVGGGELSRGARPLRGFAGVDLLELKQWARIQLGGRGHVRGIDCRQGGWMWWRTGFLYCIF